MKYRLIKLVVMILLILIASGSFDSAKSAVAAMPFQAADYPPEPVPEWQPPRQVSDTTHYMTAYDMETGQQYTIPVVENPDAPSAAFHPGALPADFTLAADSPNLPEDFSALTEVANPGAYPWVVNVKLFETWPTGVGSSCSGVLIDSKHVLTAGHCVFTYSAGRCNSPDTSCWASSIRVIPGYEDGAGPFGEANSTNVYSWSGWTVDQNYEWDMGYILLNRPVGALTGWHGYGTNTDDFFNSESFDNPGYPADAPYDGESMWNWFGTYDNVTTNILYIERASIPGQSGSGTYDINASGNRIVYAVQSHNQTSGGDTDAGQVRMVSTRYNSIASRITTNTPTSVDLVGLNSVGPATVPAGQALSSFNYLIHNYSSVTYNNNVDVRVYLSSNDNITTADILLNTHTVSLNLGPKQSTRVTLPSPPTIPLGTAGGDYYLGVMIMLTDFNEFNNDSSTWDASPIHVYQCDTPTAPTLETPGNGAYTNSVPIFFNWSYLSAASRYQIMADNNGDWSSPEVNTYPSISEYSTSALNDALYYWAARGHNQTNGCNVWGNWSSVRSFTLDRVDPTNPTSLTSSSHSLSTWSNDNTVTANWSGAADSLSGVAGYSVQWSTSSTTLPDETNDTSSSSTTSSVLANGSSWYFHLRTADQANNWSNSALHLGPFYIDTALPTSSVNSLAVTSCNAFTVSWGGSDSLSGVRRYDVQYRVGSGGTWTNWLTGTTATSAVFGPSSPLATVIGQAYYFRTRATDWAGNVEVYPTGDGDAWTLVSYCVYTPVIRR